MASCSGLGGLVHIRVRCSFLYQIDVRQHFFSSNHRPMLNQVNRTQIHLHNPLINSLVSQPATSEKEHVIKTLYIIEALPKTMRFFPEKVSLGSNSFSTYQKASIWAQLCNSKYMIWMPRYSREFKSCLSFFGLSHRSPNFRVAQQASTWLSFLSDVAIFLLELLEQRDGPLRREKIQPTQATECA